jgi:hypothetical protein
MIGIDKIGSIHARAMGIFLDTLSGSIAATMPRMVATIRTVPVQPYQYMAGPSPFLGASHPQAMRLVAGWKVNSGRFHQTQLRYVSMPAMLNVIAKLLNLDDFANEVGRVAAAVLAVAVALVFMIRTPEHC